jgi:hypothetical protein
MGEAHTLRGDAPEVGARARTSMAKHSKHERERRAAETTRVKEIESAWLGSLPSAQQAAFADAVRVARERPPEPKAPDMAPGTLPRPPRPGFEPKPPKEPARSRRSY